jgi:hypothetical protein
MKSTKKQKAIGLGLIIGLYLLPIITFGAFTGNPFAVDDDVIYSAPLGNQGYAYMAPQGDEDVLFASTTYNTFQWNNTAVGDYQLTPYSETPPNVGFGDFYNGGFFETLPEGTYVYFLPDANDPCDGEQSYNDCLALQTGIVEQGTFTIGSGLLVDSSAMMATAIGDIGGSVGTGLVNMMVLASSLIGLGIVVNRVKRWVGTM